jgi:hypothetical protein
VPLDEELTGSTARQTRETNQPGQARGPFASRAFFRVFFHQGMQFARPVIPAEFPTAFPPRLGTAFEHAVFLL